jgi:hypothetical protein
LSLEFVEGIDLVRSIKAGCIKLEHNKDRVALKQYFIITPLK